MTNMNAETIEQMTDIFKMVSMLADKRAEAPDSIPVCGELAVLQRIVHLDTDLLKCVAYGLTLEIDEQTRKLLTDWWTNVGNDLHWAGQGIEVLRVRELMQTAMLEQVMLDGTIH
jgi:hypothetical protein